MLENKVFGMISLGCDKNRVDAERLLAIVRDRGFAVTDDISEANILIVNTCAFLDSARREAISSCAFLILIFPPGAAMIRCNHLF